MFVAANPQKERGGITTKERERGIDSKRTILTFIALYGGEKGGTRIQKRVIDR